MNEPRGFLSLVLAPVEEPVSLVEAKAQLRVTVSTFDTIIGSKITMARDIIEQVTSRALTTQRWALIQDRFPDGRSRIRIPKPPLASVLTVQYFDANGDLQTWDPSQYVVVTPAGPRAHGGVLQPAPGSAYPATADRPDAVTITFACGSAAAAVAPALKSAVLLLTGHFYEQRESVVVGTIASELPRGVQWLIAGFMPMELA